MEFAAKRAYYIIIVWPSMVKTDILVSRLHIISLSEQHTLVVVCCHHDAMHHGISLFQLPLRGYRTYKAPRLTAVSVLDASKRLGSHSCECKIQCTACTQVQRAI
jgi:hypothetical protein